MRTILLLIVLFIGDFHSVAVADSSFLEEARARAGKGDAGAQTALGNMYSLGVGVPQDYGEAFKWYRKAAAQGDAEAQASLGMMYDLGQGVPQDYGEAFKWYRKAAAQGSPLAQYSLGVLYYAGHGVPQDYIQAYTWLNLAASRLPAGPKQNLAATARDSIAAKMTPAQIAAAQKLAREWKPTAPKP